MRFNTLFFLLIISFVCLALAQVSYDDCCLKYVKKINKGTQRHAVKYRHQKPDGGCNIPAVIFIMRKGRMFCTNPSDTWVKELMLKIDEKEARKHHQHNSKRG
ncbi:C-C motif chemokine 25 [Leuresthes tenuis]|uniref:C-C motif chemokine 25 n=1 Tax=Leuresthes tenuis TaxID=355514 RepID=UPI003B50ED11